MARACAGHSSRVNYGPDSKYTLSRAQYVSIFRLWCILSATCNAVEEAKTQKATALSQHTLKYKESLRDSVASCGIDFASVRFRSEFSVVGMFPELFPRSHVDLILLLFFLRSLGACELRLDSLN